MQFVFEDSEVAGLEVSCGAIDVLTVRFSAARVYEETGKTGSGEGLWMPLLLICELEVKLDKGLEASGRLESGSLMLDGQRLRTLSFSLTSPYEMQQSLVLELEFASGPSLQIQGGKLQLRTLGMPSTVESFQCG